MKTTQFFSVYKLLSLIPLLVSLFWPISSQSAIERISFASDGSQSNDWSEEVNMSGDGRYVVFTSNATNLVPNDNNNASDVFLYDRVTSDISRVSVNSNGEESNYDSYYPSISNGGRYIVFGSYASNLVIDDNNNSTDIFLHDRITKTTKRISQLPDGTESIGSSYTAEISADGKFIVFASSATNLVPNDTNTLDDIFRYSVNSGEIVRVSVNSAGEEAPYTSTQNFSYSSRPSISADGRYVVFESKASNFADGDNSDTSIDVFVRDIVSGTTEVISVNSAGEFGDQDSGSYDNSKPVISADGRYVSFASRATNLVPQHVANTNNIYLVDRGTQVISRIDIPNFAYSSWFDENPKISADGNYISLVRSIYDPQKGTNMPTLYLYNAVNDEINRITEFSHTKDDYDHALSPDGNYLSIATGINNLVPHDTNETTDIFVIDITEPVVIGPILQLQSAIQQKVINGEIANVYGVGERFNWTYSVENIGDTVANNVVVYGEQQEPVLENQWSVLCVIGEIQPNSIGQCQFSDIVDTGLYKTLLKAEGFGLDNEIADTIVTTATYIGKPALTQQSNISVEKVSRSYTDGDTDAWSEIDDMSIDGRFVLYSSGASNIVVSDTDYSGDLFLFDRDTNITQRVAYTHDGSEVNSDVYEGSISHDGRYVVYITSATNMMPGDIIDPNMQFGTGHIYLYDRTLNQTTRVTELLNGEKANDFSSSPKISGNGKYIVFESSATNLVTDDTNDVGDIFTYEITTGEIKRVSISSEGIEANRESYTPSISTNGQIVFTSYADNLVDGDVPGQSYSSGKDVFAHDIESGRTLVVSVNNSAEFGNGESENAMISDNGRFVVYVSGSTNLVQGDDNSSSDIFLKDLATQTTDRIILPENVFLSYSKDPTISADGQMISFVGIQYDYTSNKAFPAVYVYDHQNSYIRKIAEYDYSADDLEHTISPDGKTVAFATQIDSLIPLDTNDFTDVFIIQLHPYADLLMDFGSAGLWAKMNDNSWMKLSNISPDKSVLADIDGDGIDEIIADFSSTIGGIYIKRNPGGWSKLHNSASQDIQVGDLDANGKEDVVIDFGSFGLWARMNDSVWKKLNNASPDQIVLADMDGNGADDVVAYFGAYNGIYVKMNLGAWAKLHNKQPDSFVTGDFDNNDQDDLVIDFGAIGLWVRMNNDSWVKLHNVSPEILSTGDIDGDGQDEILASFTGGLEGLWKKRLIGSWSQISRYIPDNVVTADLNGLGQDDVIADFGSTIGGIYRKNTLSGWFKLHNDSPQGVTVGNLD